MRSRPPAPYSRYQHPFFGVHTWTLDGSVDYLIGKHIICSVVFALITLIVTLAYTLYILVNCLKIHHWECSRDEAQDGDDNQQEKSIAYRKAMCGRGSAHVHASDAAQCSACSPFLEAFLAALGLTVAIANIPVYLLENFHYLYYY